MDEQKTTPCQTRIAAGLSSHISGLSKIPNEQVVASIRARATTIEHLFTRFTAASGTEIPAPRRIALIEMLNDRGYTHAEYQAAEAWILKGGPCRYGKLTLADFYPTREQIDSVDFDISAIERRAYDAGYRVGYDAGVAQATEVWRDEVRKVRATE